MKAKIRVEATVDISPEDYSDLKKAGGAELVTTAQAQGATMVTKVEMINKDR